MIKSKVHPNPNQQFADALYSDKYKILLYRDKIIDTFMISKVTLDNWLSGKIKIRPVYFEKIAEILGQPINVLFPNAIHGKKFHKK